MVKKRNLELDGKDSTFLINQLTSDDQQRIWKLPDHWILTLPSSSFSVQIHDTWTPPLKTNQESEPALPNACVFPAKSLDTASPENVNIIWPKFVHPIFLFSKPVFNKVFHCKEKSKLPWVFYISVLWLAKEYQAILPVASLRSYPMSSWRTPKSVWVGGYTAS